jgi:predicted aspartyl protease
LVLWAAAAALAGEAKAKLALETYVQRLGYRTIKFQLNKHNHLITRCTVFGKERETIVDTCCPVTTLDETLSKGLQTLEAAGIKLEDPILGARVAPTALVVIPTLACGELRFFNQPAMVDNLRTVLGLEHRLMIGFDFLLRYHALLDCRHGRLHVRGAKPSKEAAAALEETLRRSGYSPVPFHMAVSWYPACEATFQGQPVKLLVDTGAVWSLVDKRLVERTRLKTRATAAEALALSTKYPMPVDFAKVKSLELSGVCLEQVEFGVVSPKFWELGDQKLIPKDVDGLLGADFLVLYGAVIDCSARKLWLDANPKRK